MGFAGNLRTLRFPEVVQTLTRIEATGVLRLARPDSGCDVVFRAGVIIGVSMREGAERHALLQRLVVDGRLDAQAAARLSSSGSETQVVQALREQQLVTDDMVAEARCHQAEEDVHDLCTWEAADFVFLDAIPDEPDVVAMVAHAEAFGLQLNTNTLLMEAARRLDEWERLRIKMPAGNVVIGPAQGGEARLLDMSQTYPAAAVVPLIDAVRTMDDLIRDAVAPRLEVCQVLDDLLERGLVAVLSREDVVAHADYWHEKTDFRQAACLYRRALAYQGHDSQVYAKLGSCLEHVGEGREAASCYGQMAIGLLEQGVHDQATSYASHAVSLQPRDTALRLTLARCQLMRGDTTAAVGELRAVTTICLDHGQLEDARGTCLKILDLVPGDEEARRELARIYSRAEHDQHSEDVIVCVQCGAVNHREATACTACQGALQLSCLGCGRIVALSDPLCIFCGDDPHAGRPERTAGGSPTTSRILRQGERPMTVAVPIQEATRRESGPQLARERGTAFWRDQLDQSLQQARAHEEAGQWEEALLAWRDVAKVQLGNAELLSHIKTLEIRVNQQATERNIESGHALRRTRHYWQAAKAYRAALRAMASDDARIPPIQEALRRTEQDQRRIAMIYGAAGAVLVLLGVVAARPYVQSYQFRHTADRVATSVDGLATAPLDGVAELLQATTGSIESLVADAERIRGGLGTTAKNRASEVRASFVAVRMQIGQRWLEQVEKAIAEQRPTEAEQGLQHLAETLSEVQPDHQAKARQALAALKGRLKVREDEAKAAPAKLAAARTSEEQGHLADALAAYRDVAATTHVEAAAGAAAAMAKLAAQETAAAEAWKTLQAELNAATLSSRRQLLTAETTVHQCQAWNRDAERLRWLNDTERQLTAAAQAYAGLGQDPSPEALQAFLTDHPGAPEVARVTAQLAEARAQREACARALAGYRAHVAAQQWAQAWQAGRDAVQNYGRLLPSDAVRLPLRIESQPAGATVTWHGQVVGTTPWVLQYAPGEDGEVAVALPGWKPQTFRLSEVASEWRTVRTFARIEAWRFDVGHRVDGLGLGDDNLMLATVGDSVAVIERRGALRWRHAVLGGGDDLVGGGRTRLPHVPQLLPGGGYGFGGAGHDVIVVDRHGTQLARHPTTAEVRGRPVVYTNDAYGTQPRWAMAAEALWSGPVGGELARIPLPSPALAGPVVVERGLDCVLVLVLTDGRVVGVEESTKAQAWPALNLQASDVSQLVPCGTGRVAAVLDGTRLAVLRVSAEAVMVAWTQTLKSPVVGDPVSTPTLVAVAAGTSVARFSVSGTSLAPLSLPSPATSMPALDGDQGVVGCQDGTLWMWKGDQWQWSTPCGAPVTAVALVPGFAIAGLADGAVVAFPR